MSEFGTEFQRTLEVARRSPATVYRELVWGAGSWPAFLWFELLTSLLGPMPGAAGLLLRRVLYRPLLGRLGRGCTIGRDVVIRHPRRISIGDGVVIDDGVVLDAKGPGGGITIHDGVVLSRGVVLSCKGGPIVIGERANLAIGCVVHAGAEVRVGKYNLLAAHCYLVGVGNHGMDRTDIPMMAQPVVSRGVSLGDDVWLGAKVVVLDGVTIGQGAVVGACSLVTRDIPPYAVAVGCPARVIRRRGGA